MKTYIFLFLITTSVLYTSCQQHEQAPAEPATPAEVPRTQKGMIKVDIIYPNGEGHTFDMDYYANQHMPMVAELFGDSLKFYRIDKGISGRTPDDPIPYLAIGTFYFDQLSAYQNSFGPNAEKILSDIPNYTNIQPEVLISEVVEWEENQFHNTQNRLSKVVRGGFYITINVSL